MIAQVKDPDGDRESGCVNLYCMRITILTAVLQIR